MSSMCAMFVSIVVLCLIQVSVGLSQMPRPGNAEAASRKGDISFPDDLNTEKFSRQSHWMHHHHHHHQPNFHQHTHSWDEEDTLPEVDGLDRTGPNSSMQIPLGFIQNINKYAVNDLLLNFVEGYKEEEEETPFLKDRFGEVQGQERKASLTTPKEAGCMPEVQTIQIASSNDSTILYIPQCTRIERCGGCCSHSLLSCQPTEIETVNFRVYKTQYTGGQKLKVVSKEIVPVEKHTKCVCGCRIKAKDCNRFQEYKESECRCTCTNSDEEKKCNKNSKTKLWNPDLCVCQCRETLQCSTGSYFDQNECRCIMVPMKRRFAEFDRKIYKYDALPVVPLDGDY